MKAINKVTKLTGKNCTSCGGNIVEIFSKKYGKDNGVIGPGYHCPSWTSSDGFGCEKCGQKYGEPVFTATKATEEIKFELSLMAATLKRKIALKDFPLIRGTKWIKSKTNNLPDYIKKIAEKNGKKIQSRVSIETTKKIRKIPPELKELEVGTEVYIPPNDLGTDGFVTIILKKEKGSQKYIVNKDCIK